MLFEYICWNLYIGILWWMHNRSNSMQYVSNSMQYVFKLYAIYFQTLCNIFSNSTNLYVYGILFVWEGGFPPYPRINNIVNTNNYMYIFS